MPGTTHQVFASSLEARPLTPRPTDSNAWPWAGLVGGVLVVAALLGLLAVAPSAKAGDDRHGRSYDRDRGGISFSIGVGSGHRSRDRGFSLGVRYDHRDRGTRWRVRTTGHVSRDTFRVRGGYEHQRDYGHGPNRSRQSRDYRRSHGEVHVPSRPVQRRVVTYDRPVHRPVHRPSGRWNRVWCPPVYRTVYDGCGGYRRVCVRAGYYRRVWVSAGVGHGY